MPIIYCPYRWTGKYWYRNLSQGWSDICHGVANIVRWMPIIWHDQHWNEGYLLRILRYKFTKMADSLGQGCLLRKRRERSAKQCRICAELCKRLSEDKYFENAGYNENFHKLPSYTCSQIVTHSNKMRTQDQRYLGMMLSKHLSEWWD